MRTSAPGSSRTPVPRRRSAGFTLIELLVVVAIIAIATAGVAFAMRDSAGAHLDREAQRLSALFEAARAISRSSGRPVVWRPTESGFRFEGLPEGTLSEQWLQADTRVAGSPAVVLGPEPVIGPQEVVLVSPAAPQVALRIATDGVRPFAVANEGTP